jgi:hypothetical protein
MKKEDKYEVESHTFKGPEEFNGKVIGYTYEITFNKSLEHTGRIKGIEDGLNNYVKKERSLIEVIKDALRNFVDWIRN